MALGIGFSKSPYDVTADDVAGAGVDALAVLIEVKAAAAPRRAAIFLSIGILRKAAQAAVMDAFVACYNATPPPKFLVVSPWCRSTEDYRFENLLTFNPAFVELISHFSVIVARRDFRNGDYSGSYDCWIFSADRAQWPVKRN
jgi:hypothetical protein